MKRYTVFYTKAYQIDVNARDEQHAIDKAHNISLDKWMEGDGDTTAEVYSDDIEARLWVFVWGLYTDKTSKFMAWDDIVMDDSITDPLDLDAMAVGQCIDRSGPLDVLHIYRVR
jgi:hypothetical protein